MTTKMIELHTADASEQAACQSWDIWESGDLNTFNYDYDQDVEFIVQQGSGVIRTQCGEEITINAGSRVVIRQRVSACWEIHSPIINRYQYL